MTKETRHIKEFQLLLKVRRGDEKAFETLFDIYKDKVYAFSYKMLKSKDLADDITIEVFIKIWKNRASIQSGLAFQAYVFRITKNHIINFLNKASLDIKVQKQLATAANYYRSSTEEEIIYNDYLTLAEQAICQMPRQRRLVFRLKNEKGMSYEQIAAHLGVSKNTVKSHLTAATSHMRSIFNMYSDKTAMLMVLLFNDLFF
ncbi:RNA polymerase sigma-70 factor [Fulvivirgaceae bacterium BMA10]|uniref:RNA polymerase sigma-70 factor n=1 Tax=Splendidivirga corallicola TaxID=3051826 RepID=A0ABT8KU14_9BACT|nr:RNA polymerase sigma-70 factor [Fulvivirgaceae bacterium BMA10]